MTNIEKDIEVLVRDFATKLVEMTAADCRQRAMAAVSSAAVESAGGATSTLTKKADRPAKRTLKLSPKGVAARKVQGQYLGMLRGLTAGKRAQVKKIAREQGVAAALKFGRTLK